MTEPAHDPGEGTGAPTLEKTTATTGTAGGETEEGGLAQSASAARFEPGGASDGPAGRFWSVRRVPAALVATVLLGASGVLLYDIATVRADGTAAAWRRTLADELATRRLDDPWVVSCAAAAMLIGIWLMALATTPGLRGLLPMRQDSDEMRAGIERSAAAVVLRDRAMEVSGVQSVRVRVGRRRIQVLTEAHFRELDAVRSDLDAVLEQGIRELGLARQPALSVHVRRPPKR
ncbi:DUF6286 domain-containing protein [Streptomyces sp. URMC 129]|uniref:DUF6286 domain-containing protein n=1 Tax=Streptomyces sp. URMC 129 TaxID=3423407 RepID=UPI003F1E22C8